MEMAGFVLLAAMNNTDVTLLAVAIVIVVITLIAMARQQEMLALVQENRAKLVLAEAEIPVGIAASFRGRQVGILDDFELKNIDADTRMRTGVSGVAFQAH